MPTEAELASGLTAERVRELLDYDPTTGVFRWRGTRRGVPLWKSNEAGCVHTGKNAPRRQIHIGGRLFYASRLAWLLMTGHWPGAEVDHINRDQLDDRWDNLREASASQNRVNRDQPNGSGLPRGVRQSHDKTGHFTARITVKKREYHLGTFRTPEAAHAAYLQAVKATFGDFLPKAS